MASHLEEKTLQELRKISSDSYRGHRTFYGTSGYIRCSRSFLRAVDEWLETQPDPQRRKLAWETAKEHSDYVLMKADQTLTVPQPAAVRRYPLPACRYHL